MSTNPDNSDSAFNNRKFPRIDTRCPILFQEPSSPRWQVGVMMNMSAVGFQMSCKQPLAQNLKLEFKYQPGSNRLVPRMGGDAVVVRCEPLTNGEYSVSCKLVRVVALKAE